MPTRKALTLRERFPIFPLEHMLAVLNDSNASDDRRDNMAKAAAPYIHPRLAAVEITGKESGPAEGLLDLSKLTDDELAPLECIVLKSQKTMIDNDEVVQQIEYDDSGYKR